SRKGTFICGLADALTIRAAPVKSFTRSAVSRCHARARHSSGECFNLKNLFCFGGGESWRRASGRGECHRCAVHFEGSTSRFEDLPRLEPAALNGRKALARKGERHVCHVLYPRRNMSVSLAVNRGGKFVKNMENDRYVVRRQVPGDINVLLE